jgi:putative Mg2+ transporter-C (MgtC) family protein
VGPGLDIALVVRLLLASLLGAVIGLEREIHGRPAGFRTHLLVSLGSCLFVISSVEFYRIFGNFSGGVPVGVDPGRVAAQVVTGIGFLGAGAIIREKASIRGLTTAACLWVAAALGIACGIGLFYLAISVTIIALASLMLLKRVENRLPKDTYFLVRVWGDDGEGLVQRIDRALDGMGVRALDGKFEKNIPRKSVFMEFQVKCTGKFSAVTLIDGLCLLSGVKRIRVE